MKVFVVIKTLNNYRDFEYVEGVYSTQGRAETQIRRLEKKNISTVITYNWEYWEVNDVAEGLKQ